jgi:hypothetical protein
MSALRDFSNWVKAVGPSALASAPPASKAVAAAAAPAQAVHEAKSPSPANGDPDPANLDPAQWIAVDLSQLKQDLAKTGPLMKQALDAAQEMNDAAARAGIDIRDPGKALAGATSLTAQEKTDIAQSLDQVQAGVNDVYKTMHLMTEQRDLLKAEEQTLRSLPEKLKEDFFKDLKAKADDAVGGWEHIWDFMNVMSQLTPTKLISNMAHALAGTDQVKDLVKALFDDEDARNARIAQLGETVNALITAAGQDATRKIQIYYKAMEDLKDDYFRASRLLRRELGHYHKVISSVASKVGSALPDLVAKAGAAIEDALSLSTKVRTTLDATQTLARQKYEGQWTQLKYPGKLVLDAPDEGEPVAPGMMTVGGDLTVYEKGGKQYAYRESTKTLQNLVEQLEVVRRVWDSGKRVDEVFEKWSDALSS